MGFGTDLAFNDNCTRGLALLHSFDIRVPTPVKSAVMLLAITSSKVGLLTIQDQTWFFIHTAILHCGKD
jgi:hypothetical protein